MQHNVRWAHPMTLGFDAGEERLIRGAAEALQSLGKWPEAERWFFEGHAALKMEGDVELARQAVYRRIA